MIRPKPRHHSLALSCMIPRMVARVLAATLTGTALFVSAPARADYDACMTFCLDEHRFSYCHPICDGSASNAGTAGDTGNAGGTVPVVPLFTAEKCRTLDERDTAIGRWITQTYGIVSIGIRVLDDEAYVLEVRFATVDGTEDCTGIVTFDDACRVFETQKIECAPKK